MSQFLDNFQFRTDIERLTSYAESIYHFRNPNYQFSRLFSACSHHASIDHGLSRRGSHCKFVTCYDMKRVHPWAECWTMDYTFCLSLLMTYRMSRPLFNQLPLGICISANVIPIVLESVVGLLAHQHFTAFCLSATNYQRSDVLVVGKLCFHIWFDFALLPLRTALLTVCSSFRWLCHVRISDRDCFIDGGKMFDSSLKLVVIYFCCTFTRTLTFYGVCTFWDELQSL